MFPLQALTLLLYRHIVSMPGMAFSVMDALGGVGGEGNNTKTVTIKGVPTSMSNEVA